MSKSYSIFQAGNALRSGLLDDDIEHSLAALVDFLKNLTGEYGLDEGDLDDVIKIAADLAEARLRVLHMISWEKETASKSAVRLLVRHLKARAKKQQKATIKKHFGPLLVAVPNSASPEAESV